MSNVDENFEKINLGCGNVKEKKFPLPWLNVDIGSEIADYQCDIKNLPSEWENKFIEVRASHVLEHIYQKEWKETIATWIKVLKPSGTLRIIVPDLDVVLAVLQKGFDSKGRKSRPDWSTTPALAQIYGIGYDNPETDERWRHKIIVDSKFMIDVLESYEELTSVEVYDKKEDPAFILGIKDDSQNEFSLCVKAIKK